MTARLKTYRAEIGGAHEWIVAAPSQKAAAAIWGIDLGVFKEGRGGPTTIPEFVKAALAKPGTPLRRVLNGKGPFRPIPSSDVETWALAAKAMGIDPSRPPPRPKSGPKKKKPKVPPKPPKPCGPSRAALAQLKKAQTALAAFRADRERRSRRHAAEHAALEARHAKANRVSDDRLKTLERKLDEALAATGKTPD